LTKKILFAASGFSLIILSVTLVILYLNTENDLLNSKIVQKADVVMSVKSSRPGCEVTNSCYSPSEILINSGDSITWLNGDTAFHSVTSGFYDAPNNIFDSGYLDPKESFTFFFEDIGKYDYFCTLHPWMKGQIIVEGN
jgi:plastocyanin